MLDVLRNSAKTTLGGGDFLYPLQYHSVVLLHQPDFFSPNHLACSFPFLCPFIISD